MNGKRMSGVYPGRAGQYPIDWDNLRR